MASRNAASPATARAAVAAPAASALPVRFAEQTCGWQCAIECRKEERILNVMAMAPADGMSLTLQSESRGTYSGPEKGMIKVVVVCLRK